MTEITIDGDKACTVCGQMGATGAGLCLGCIADGQFNLEDLLQEGMVLATKQINNLLIEHRAQVHRAYLQAGSGGISIGVKIDMEPSKEMQNTIVVISHINFVESRVKDAMSGRVSAQHKLPM